MTAAKPKDAPQDDAAAAADEQAVVAYADTPVKVITEARPGSGVSN